MRRLRTGMEARMSKFFACANRVKSASGCGMIWGRRREKRGELGRSNPYCFGPAPVALAMVRRETEIATPLGRGLFAAVCLGRACCALIGILKRDRLAWATSRSQDAPFFLESYAAFAWKRAISPKSRCPMIENVCATVTLAAMVP